ncbi:glutamate ABC transporter substrate-binding protein [Rhodococcus sp. X156]|uniref:glutamate ABC transporter substrate-binding protein n=1 Tax=Rhodococcus sp. X156 TaxID=2499145 RepID=UPI000FD87DC9|nr:glutamate ABC transporter substrate-binding protein [Rhodococcus sp. X156]
MRRRVIKAAAGATLLTLVMTACGSSSSDESAAPVADKPTFAEGTTMASVASSGKLRVGIKFDQPGFGKQGLSGKYEGFDVQMAQIVAAGLGLQPDAIEFTEAPSARREELIETKKVDMVVATYTINDKRKERVSFAGPYYVAGQQLMVDKDDTTITGPDSLKTNPDAKVCSVTGSTPGENIKKYVANPNQVVLFDVYSKCADALRTGQVQAVTTDNVILLGFVAGAKDDFKLTGEQFTQEPYGIGIAKGDVPFCQFIHEQLTKAKESGAYEKAWKDTAGEVEGAQTPELPALAACS